LSEHEAEEGVEGEDEKAVVGGEERVVGDGGGEVGLAGEVAGGGGAASGFELDEGHTRLGLRFGRKSECDWRLHLRLAKLVSTSSARHSRVKAWAMFNNRIERPVAMESEMRAGVAPSDEEARLNAEESAKLARLLSADGPLPVQGFVGMASLPENGNQRRGGLAGCFQQVAQPLCRCAIIRGKRVATVVVLDEDSEEFHEARLAGGSAVPPADKFGEAFGDLSVAVIILDHLGPHFAQEPVVHGRSHHNTSLS
jgi:hypothetical protein